MRKVIKKNVIYVLFDLLVCLSSGNMKIEEQYSLQLAI